MATAIILGTARIEGCTQKVVAALQEQTDWDCYHLADYNISYYDYEHTNIADDFLPLMKELLAKYTTFVLATPVYWYSMSGRMKVFLDRWTDLLTIEKDLGRRLRGKSMAVITSSIGNHLDEQFWLPFTHTADYLGMRYLANLHTIETSWQSEDLQSFIQKVEQGEKDG